MTLSLTNLAEYFNLNESDPILSEFLFENDSKNSIRTKKFSKKTENWRNVDLFITIVVAVHKIQQL